MNNSSTHKMKFSGNRKNSGSIFLNLRTEKRQRFGDKDTKHNDTCWIGRWGENFCIGFVDVNLNIPGISIDEIIIHNATFEIEELTVKGNEITRWLGPIMLINLDYGDLDINDIDDILYKGETIRSYENIYDLYKPTNVTDLLRRLLLTGKEHFQVAFTFPGHGTDIEDPGMIRFEPGNFKLSIEYETKKIISRVVPESKIQILFLAANPIDTNPLRLDEEIRSIDRALREATFRDRFNIEQQWAVRVQDLQSHLLRFKPHIVHFSGHGSVASEIILEDISGNSRTVPVKALSQLFRVLKDNIRCVVLNACYSVKQAEAIAEHIDCVVGMSKDLGDLAAINFAISFYQALGYGRNVKDAFELGLNQIDLESLDERDTPQLLCKNCDPREIVFI